jgi:spermidine/putrescine transport system ATP-binding protein
MLAIENISFHYGVLDMQFGIQIAQAEFRQGEVTCILGRNGSGKTTLLSLIGGHLTPASGQILLDGQDMALLTVRDRPTATVFQQLGLFPHLTVAQNVKAAIEPNTLFRYAPETITRCQEVLCDFDLTVLHDKKPQQLSVGQQQRVAIARAVATSPKVLLLDEPTSALDFAHIRVLRDTLKYLKSSGKVPVIIIISHDLHFVLDIADNIKYFEEGRIQFDGTTDEFKSTPYYIN